MQEQGNRDPTTPLSVPRLPLGSLRQNSLHLTDWTAGLTFPGSSWPARGQIPQPASKLAEHAQKEHGGLAGSQTSGGADVTATKSAHAPADQQLSTPGRPMREAPLSTPGPTPGRPAAALLSPCHTPLRRCGISGAPQRVATPAARSERPERPLGFRPPLRPEPFTLMSPRTDATQHMAHQRAAAEAARLQRQPRPPQGAAEAHHAEGHIIAGDRMPRQESGQGGGRTLRAAPPPARRPMLASRVNEEDGAVQVAATLPPCSNRQGIKAGSLVEEAGELELPPAAARGFISGSWATSDAATESPELLPAPTADVDLLDGTPPPRSAHGTALPSEPAAPRGFASPATPAFAGRPAGGAFGSPADGGAGSPAAGSSAVLGTPAPLSGGSPPAGSPAEAATPTSAEALLQGGPRAVSPEVLSFLQAAQDADDDTEERNPMATPARRLEGDLPHRTPLGRPQRVPDSAARPVLSRELRQLTAGGGGGGGAAQLDGALGSISLLSPVRVHAGRGQPRLVAQTVATPVRRSARRPPAPQSVTSVLQQTGFAYAPNTVGVPASGEVEHDALASPPPRRTGAWQAEYIMAEDATEAAAPPAPASPPAAAAAQPRLTVELPAAEGAGEAAQSPEIATPSPAVAALVQSSLSPQTPQTPATPAEGFQQRVTRQMSAVKAGAQASARKRGSGDSGSASKSPSPSMSPTELQIRQSLRRSARKKQAA